jgi:hypothetical protein
MFRTKSSLKLVLSSIALCTAVLSWSPSAEAGASTGTWRNGMRAGPVGPGHYGPGGSYYAPRPHYRRDRGYYGRGNYGDNGYRAQRRYQRGYAVERPYGPRVEYYD